MDPSVQLLCPLQLKIHVLKLQMLMELQFSIWPFLPKWDILRFYFSTTLHRGMGCSELYAIILNSGL
jgi:hypothetical protein